MLKIDVIKFETQDVITTSTPAPVNCNCGNDGCYYDDTIYIKASGCTCPINDTQAHNVPTCLPE